MAKLPFAIGLSLLLSLFNLLADAPATAQGELRWLPKNIPAQGDAGGWTLAKGSDVNNLAVAIDGSLYAGVDGLDYTLFKSTDGGSSWQPAGGVTDDIVDIVTDPDDAGTVYYATATNVYKSIDSGNSFLPLGVNPALGSSDNTEIMAIDVARWGGRNFVVAGIRDRDAGEYGGVYILDEGQAFAQWLDTAVGNYDVYCVAFSPRFGHDQQIVAVVTDETDTLITTKIGDADWGQTIGDARLGKDNTGTPVIVANSADIVFPDDYSSDWTTGQCIQFVAIDTGNDSGDVYAIYGMAAPDNSEAVDLNIGSGYELNNMDVTSLAISGQAANGQLLAGAASSSQIYHSRDGGSSWTRSLKEPTGQSETRVIMSADFPDQGRAYAATSGAESAVSTTLDGGASWNQTGLIDTEISTIVDLAVSPNYEQDKSLFMLTWGGKSSLWRSLDDGAHWQRVFSGALEDVDVIDLVRLSPQYGSGSQVVFLAGSRAGSPVIWEATDNGQSFIYHNTPLPVDQWAIADDTTLFLGGFDGNNGLVYRTTDSGLNYSAAVVGSQPVSSIALSPSYDQDRTILVGNSNGWIYISSDNGASFAPLPLTATPPLTGDISVAFDPQFSSNHTVYAASDSPDAGISRFDVGTSTDWENIDTSLPDGSMIGKLEISTGDTLYAANFQQVDSANDRGGIERCLNPESESHFETITQGLDNGVTLFDLWLCGHQLWSIDTTDNHLMTYIDSLAVPINLTWPPDQASGIGTVTNGTVSGLSLDWEIASGATGYQWQLDDDDDFSSIPAGFEGSIEESSTTLPALKPDTTYRWRVRAVQPVASPWSEKWSFTTSSDVNMVAPEPESPPDGATGLPIRPVFQWSPVAGATGYEIAIAASPDFANSITIKVGGQPVPGHSYQLEVSLSYATTYYWKVRAVSSDLRSAWSTAGIFTTEPEPEPNQSSEPAPQPPVTLTTVTVLAPESTANTEINPGANSTIGTTTQPAQPQPPPAQTASAIPEWVFYTLSSMGAIIILLIAILALVIKRH